MGAVNAAHAVNADLLDEIAQLKAENRRMQVDTSLAPDPTLACTAPLFAPTRKCISR